MVAEARGTVDRWVWGAMLVAVVLRALPLLLFGWATDECTRDECIFRIVARTILEGEGLGLAPRGWLPAPLYPYLLAGTQAAFGRFEAVKWLQSLLAAPTVLAWAWAASQAYGLRTARWTAWGVALHPTLVFFSTTMWTESLYVMLLGMTVAWTLAGRTRSDAAALAGVSLGAMVLLRGVATYTLPLFLLALAVPEDEPWAVQRWLGALRSRARSLAVFLVAALLVVAPYSASASARWGGFVVSDATLGHVAAMGNDDYPPLTFDYGNGQLTGAIFSRTLSQGRRDCPRRDGPLAADRCEVERAARWIADHPATFLARVPERWAQLLNPHSFLTRHLRWHLWVGVPWAVKEALVALVALTTTVIVLVGTAGAFLRARTPFALLATGYVLYNLAVVGALYGITRFRLPLEPLWMVLALAPWTSRVGARPMGPTAWASLAGLLGLLLLLLGRYAWTGWPGLGW